MIPLAGCSRSETFYVSAANRRQQAKVTNRTQVLIIDYSSEYAKNEALRKNRISFDVTQHPFIDVGYHVTPGDEARYLETKQILTD